MPSRQMRNRLPEAQSLTKGGRLKMLIRDGRQDLDLGGTSTTTGTPTGRALAGKALDLDARNDEE